MPVTISNLIIFTCLQSYLNLHEQAQRERLFVLVWMKINSCQTKLVNVGVMEDRGKKAETVAVGFAAVRKRAERLRRLCSDTSASNGTRSCRDQRVFPCRSLWCLWSSWQHYLWPEGKNLNDHDGERNDKKRRRARLLQQQNWNVRELTKLDVFVFHEKWALKVIFWQIYLQVK